MSHDPPHEDRRVALTPPEAGRRLEQTTNDAEAGMDDDEVLRMVEGVVERIMARQHPGRPAFYALGEAHRAVRRARRVMQPGRDEQIAARYERV